MGKHCQELCERRERHRNITKFIVKRIKKIILHNIKQKKNKADIVGFMNKIGTGSNDTTFNYIQPKEQSLAKIFFKTLVSPLLYPVERGAYEYQKHADGVVDKNSNTRQTVSDFIASHKGEINTVSGSKRASWVQDNQKTIDSYKKQYGQEWQSQLNAYADKQLQTSDQTKSDIKNLPTTKESQWDSFTKEEKDFLNQNLDLYKEKMQQLKTKINSQEKQLLKAASDKSNTQNKQDKKDEDFND